MQKWLGGWPFLRQEPLGENKVKLLQDVCFFLDTLSFRDPNGMSGEQLAK